MGTAIVILILVVVAVFALKGTVKHMRGEGGCCGGGGDLKVRQPRIKDPVAEKDVTISGMHCENCGVRVTNAIAELGNVNVKVNLRKKTAHIRYGETIPDDRVVDAVEKAGYKVEKIA